MASTTYPESRTGFTLVELAIVLVIVGLIIGGVLTGREMIHNAKTSSQISQLNQIKQASLTFRNKYDGAPGDLDSKKAAQFGFASRTGAAGDGDGNGVYEGIVLGTPNGAAVCLGELSLFWADLRLAGLVNIGAIGDPYCGTTTTTTNPPLAAMGEGNNLYLYSAGNCCPWGSYGRSYLALARVTGIHPASWVLAQPSLTVTQAYSIDVKMDDGLPMGGGAQTFYANNCCNAPKYFGASDTTATPASTTTCYDNGNVGGAVQKYSTAQSTSSSNQNCALSFSLK